MVKRLLATLALVLLVDSTGISQTANVGAKFTSGGLADSTYYDNGTSSTIGRGGASSEENSIRLEVQHNQNYPTFIMSRNETCNSLALAGVGAQSGTGTGNVTVSVTSHCWNEINNIPPDAVVIHSGLDASRGIFTITDHGNVTWILEGKEFMRLNRDGELGLADGGPIVTDAKLSIHSGHDNALSVHVSDHSYSTMKMFNDSYNSGRAAAEFDILNSGKLQFGTINDADVEVIRNTEVRFKLRGSDSCVWIGGALHALSISSGVVVDGGTC